MNLQSLEADLASLESAAASRIDAVGKTIADKFDQLKALEAEIAAKSTLLKSIEDEIAAVEAKFDALVAKIKGGAPEQEQGQQEQPGSGSDASDQSGQQQTDQAAAQKAPEAAPAPADAPAAPQQGSVGGVPLGAAAS